MVEGKCFYCESDLKKQNNVYNPREKEIDQQRIHEDWNSILKLNEPIMPNLSSENKQSIALSLLYLDKNKKDPQIGLHKHEVGKLSRFVRSKGDPYSITLTLILRVIRSLNISIEEYSSLKLSEEKIRRILAPPVLRKEAIIGPCLAPWCHSFEKNDQMCVTNFTSPKLYINKTYYADIRICKGCWLRYGINKESGVSIKMKNSLTINISTSLVNQKNG